MTQLSLTTTRSPSRLLITWLPDPIRQPDPTTVVPSSHTPGAIVVSGPIVTPSSIHVRAGSNSVTPSAISA